MAKLSRENTKGNEGVKVLKNEPIEDGSGQYTQKIYEIGKYAFFLSLEVTSIVCAENL